MTSVMYPKTSWRNAENQSGLGEGAIHWPSESAAGESQKEDLPGRRKKRGLSLQEQKSATRVRGTSVPGGARSRRAGIMAAQVHTRFSL